MLSCAAIRSFGYAKWRLQVYRLMNLALLYGLPYYWVIRQDGWIF